MSFVVLNTKSRYQQPKFTLIPWSAFGKLTYPSHSCQRRHAETERFWKRSIAKQRAILAFVKNQDRYKSHYIFPFFTHITISCRLQRCNFFSLFASSFFSLFLQLFLAAICYVLQPIVTLSSNCIFMTHMHLPFINYDPL